MRILDDGSVDLRVGFKFRASGDEGTVESGAATWWVGSEEERRATRDIRSLFLGVLWSPNIIISSENLQQGP